jgi:glucose-6-phosphate 1-dehydrogenase
VTGTTQTKKTAPSVCFVIFGASGDLTARKILPALNNLCIQGSLDKNTCILGIARTPMNDGKFRSLIKNSTKRDDRWDAIVNNARYITGEYGHPDTFAEIKKVLGEMEPSTKNNVLYYLATIPEMFGIVAEGLKTHGLSGESNDSFTRVVIEKPFGRDLKSAVELDSILHRCFKESQIFRIDHYMGKENVQNLLALRFANAIFEPIWNRRYLDHIQITVAESLGVEHRGGFYESEGALRDIVQNHVMQVLSLTLMEPPADLDPNSIRDEKVKLLRSVEIYDAQGAADKTVRAQYQSGVIDGIKVPAYRDEDGVKPDSKTETYVAMNIMVDNWRWAGVPIYVRTGKRLTKRATEVCLVFQRVPHLLFPSQLSRGLHQDRLVLRIQPDEGISVYFGVKVPGQEFLLTDASMDFSYQSRFGHESPEAYERLILDALIGDPTLFIRTDEVKAAWNIIDPIIEAFRSDSVALDFYPAGSWGPTSAERLLSRTGRRWYNP